MKPARPWVLICVAGVLFGCGQKGPLVMPDAQKHKRSIPAPPASRKPGSEGGANGAAPATPDATAPTPAAPASAATDSATHP